MIAVTGATGRLGLATLEALVEKMAPSEIVAVVRDPQKAAATLPQGVVVRHGDYTTPATLLAAFQGVETVLFISSSTLEDEARLGEHRHVIDAARQAGVRHLLYTSAANAAPTSSAGAWPSHSPSHFATEHYLRASGLTYTIFRNTLYLDLVPVLVGQRTLPSGQLYASAGEGRVSYVLRKEVALALAQVLTSPGHENQVYDLTPGPAYSFRELAAALGEVTGRPVAYVPVSEQELAAYLRDQQASELFSRLLLGMNEEIKNNCFAGTSPTLARLLGRQPTTLPAYLASVYGK